GFIGGIADGRIERARAGFDDATRAELGRARAAHGLGRLDRNFVHGEEAGEALVHVEAGIGERGPAPERAPVLLLLAGPARRDRTKFGIVTEDVTEIAAVVRAIALDH